MKFSRNPVSGALESYNNDGAFGGVMVTMADFIHMTATDGGPGSGNHNHSGRPGLVGGSAPGGGGGGNGGEGEKAPEKITIKAGSSMKTIKLGEEVNKRMVGFSKMSSEQKIEFAKKKGIMPDVTKDKRGYEKWYDEAQKRGLTTMEYVNYCAEKYFAIKADSGETKTTTPLKKVESQEPYIKDIHDRVQKVIDNCGVDRETAYAMLEGLRKHFNNGQNSDPWIDRYIDSDGRYDGAIYRWKSYYGAKAGQVVASLVPGAKIGSKFDSNWSFSSDPTATMAFGGYGLPDETTILYVCDKNLTASPVMCFSTYGESEWEVIPHSKTTWTIQSVEQLPKKTGGYMYEVHMTEDDWHEERDIPVWNYEENKGSWKIKFPRDFGDVQSVYNKIKASYDKGEMSEFIEKCPDDTEFMFHPDDDDGITIMKKENGVWKIAHGKEEDLHGNIWNNIKGHAMPMQPFEKEVYFASEFTHIYKMESDVFEDKKYDFDKVKDAHDGTVAKFLDEAPAGTAFSAIFMPFSEKEMVFVKNDEGKWEDENQVYPKPLTSQEVSIFSNNQSQLKTYPKAPEKKPAPETYGEVKEKLYEYADDEDLDKLSDLYNSLPEKTQLIEESSEEVWEKQSTGKWKNLDTGDIFDSVDVAQASIDTSSFDVFELPHKPFDSVAKADKFFKDIIENSPQNMGKFVGECPNGTEIVSLENGGKFFKKFGGEWKVIDMIQFPESADVSYWEKHEDDAKNVDNVILDMMNKLKSGSFVLKYGKRT